MRALNLTLLTDLYELTMMQGYFKNPTDQIVVFDAFYRKNPCDGGYAICAGLEQVVEYIRDLHFAPDDIDYLRSLHIFDTDFLEYLRGFHFTGDIFESLKSWCCDYCEFRKNSLTVYDCRSFISDCKIVDIFVF